MKLPMQSIQPLRYSLFSCLLWISTGIMSQSFGGLRPDLGWAQINTDTVRVIFPEYLRPQAQRVANNVHYLHKYHLDQIGDKAFKIDILLNNQTTISNGFVSIAPWKSYFVTTPLQDSYQLTALPWLDLLSLHEYRHVIQLSSARRGIVNFLYYLFGQESWAGAANLSLPGWFTEGDAVWAETKQSIQGRGRIPAFLQGSRALKYSNLKYRYDKARNGSLKDYVPDHYRLGYLLVEYGHKKFGQQFWKEVMLDATAYKGIFYPFAKAMQRHCGMKPAKMYDAMWNDLASDETGRSAESGGNPIIVPNKQLKRFTDYQYPHLVGDSLLIYFERSYDQIGRFRSYHLGTKETKTIATKGVSIDPYFGGNGNFLTWTEYSTNPRWVEDDYSDIIKYDLMTNQQLKVTRQEKYFSPQSNEDGTKITCVKTTLNTASLLCLIDGQDGHVLQEISHPGWVYTYPQFGSSNDEIITAVRDASGKMALVEIDVESGRERLITPFLNRIIGIPEVRDSLVFYSASTSGVENIFATNLNSGETFQHTDETNGAFQVTAGKSDLYYVTFTAKGHLVKHAEQSNKVKSLGKPSTFELSFDQNLLDSVPDKEYLVKRYRPLTKSFNLHTWGLIIEDPNVVARVLSNNILNNVEFSAGVKYNYDEQNYRPFARVLWNV